MSNNIVKIIVVIGIATLGSVHGQLANTKLLNLDSIQQVIHNQERSFQNMTTTKGIAEAFAHYAAEDAVINRNNQLIEGNNNILEFYNHPMYAKASVDWEPQRIEVAQAGDMAYSYGNYIWKLPNQEGVLQAYRGIYFTIWKKQSNGQWKYVWD